jgi:LacI family transcriptional regulator
MPLHTASSGPGSSPHGSATTIKEVAARAGVSVATVSRALNGIGPVRKATYDRVMEAARALRFVPHSGARSLSTRTTHTVGLVMPELHGEFFSEVIRGADLAARKRGYHLIVSGSHSNREEMASVIRTMRGRVDGLLLMSPEVALGGILRELPAAMRVVTVNARTKGFPSVTIDNCGGAETMVRHLAALGHRRVAFITGPAGNADATERLRGYREACGKQHIVCSPELEIDGDFTEESGYRAALKILALSQRPTAIFAANDAMAAGALFALREQNVRVPEEMALAGFDDIPIARYVTPRLTTVTVAISELGRRAFELLLDSIAGKNGRRAPRETLPASLVVRDSCGANAQKPRRGNTGGN